MRLALVRSAVSFFIARAAACNNKHAIPKEDTFTSPTFAIHYSLNGSPWVTATRHPHPLPLGASQSFWPSAWRKSDADDENHTPQASYPTTFGAPDSFPTTPLRYNPAPGDHFRVFQSPIRALKHVNSTHPVSLTVSLDAMMWCVCMASTDACVILDVVLSRRCNDKVCKDVLCRHSLVQESAASSNLNLHVCRSLL